MTSKGQSSKRSLPIARNKRPQGVRLSLCGSHSISILGSGVVGQSLGKGLLEIGHNLIFYDVNRKKARNLRDSGLEATSQLKTAIANSTVSFFCVPTPATEKGIIDLSYIKNITQKTATELQKKEGYHLVVVKSTVVPTTTEKVIIPILEKNSGKKAGRDFGVCCNPEFLTEIHNSWTDDESFERRVSNEPFIIIGAFDDRSGDILQDVYGSLKSPIFRTDLKTAEMFKYAFNCALATRISFWNEIFRICEKLKIDSNIIAETASKDPRIGKYGTVHKKAFGGKCLPKYLSALVGFCQKIDYNPGLLKAVLRVNQEIAKEFGVRE